MCVWMLVAGGYLALMSVGESSRSKMAFALISNARGDGDEGMTDGRREARKESQK